MNEDRRMRIFSIWLRKRGRNQPPTPPNGRQNVLESTKKLVEILAIVLAGGWALFEYGAKERARRLEGDELARPVLELRSEASPLKDARLWIHANLVIKNPSKRSATTFMITWWVALPPMDGGIEGKVEKIANDFSEYDLAPGESSDVSHQFVVDRVVPALVIHAGVYMKDDDEGNVCVISPTEVLPDGGAAALDFQPRVCKRKPGSKEDCAGHGCSEQSVEQMVHIPGLY